MVSKVQRWGNSQGLRISKEMLREAQIAVGDEVDVFVQEGRIVVQPVTAARGRYRLEDLVTLIPKRRQAKEVNWGPPVGKESW